MILSGREIQKHMGKEIVIEPFDKKRLNPNSYNLSLHNQLLVYENKLLDMKTLNPVKPVSYTHLDVYKRQRVHRFPHDQ